jgi:hypothetical protein
MSNIPLARDRLAEIQKRIRPLDRKLAAEIEMRSVLVDPPMIAELEEEKPIRQAGPACCWAVVGGADADQSFSSRAVDQASRKYRMVSRPSADGPTSAIKPASMSSRTSCTGTTRTFETIEAMAHRVQNLVSLPLVSKIICAASHAFNRSLVNTSGGACIFRILPIKKQASPKIIKREYFRSLFVRASPFFTLKKFRKGCHLLKRYSSPQNDWMTQARARTAKTDDRPAFPTVRKSRLPVQTLRSCRADVLLEVANA